MSPGQGCFPAWGPVRSEDGRGMLCRTLLLGRSFDTYGVSRVPWLPAVPSIAYGALNDKNGNDIWAIRSPLRCL